MSLGTAPAPTRRRPSKPPVPWTIWVGAVALVVITLWAMLEPLGGIGFSLAPLFTEQAVAGWYIIRRFFDPEWSFLPRAYPRFVETLYIAVIASAVGCSVALPISLLASRVTNGGRVLYGLVRTWLSVVRSLPDIAWALLFVAAVGTGALGGIMALIMFNIGIIAKLTSETVDGVDLGPVEAAQASGAGRVQTAWVAVVPQILPGYLSYSLYVFELNIRASLVLGLVGAGGIGNVIKVTLSRFEYERLGAVIFAFFVIVVILDQISIALRRRLV
ncbi:MAG: phosphonate ABC transporter, permease protein PhnE [Nitriliruptor sp.]|uniref:phosphonate ABC transporter, permease protein PhnE n=1 Tax=Nitriliruptor sp. TaxID=2448056 RepID=UPI0034A02972